MRAQYTLIKIALFFSVILFLPASVHAYMGPGAGLGMVGSLIAVVLVVFLVILGLLLYPLRKLIKHFKKRSRSTNEEKTS